MTVPGKLIDFMQTTRRGPEKIAISNIQKFLVNILFYSFIFGNTHDIY